MTEQSELTAWLAELEAEIAPKVLLIASLRQRLGMEPNGAFTAPSLPGSTATPRASVDAPSGPLRSDTFFRLSIPEAIKKYLAMAKRPQSPKDIAAALKQGGVLTQASHFYANVTTALKRLRASGDVVNTKEGWGLAVWYPNKAKQNDAPKPKKTKRRSRKAPKKPPVKAAKAGTEAKPGMTYQAFVSERSKAGKNLKEISAEWKEFKANAKK